jgi:hypothetical protein
MRRQDPICISYYTQFGEVLANILKFESIFRKCFFQLFTKDFQLAVGYSESSHPSIFEFFVLNRKVFSAELLLKPELLCWVWPSSNYEVDVRYLLCWGSAGHRPELGWWPLLGSLVNGQVNKELK